MYSTAMGRACLASMPPAEQDFMMNAIRHKYDKDWLNIKSSLEQAFKDYEDFGYCFSFGDWQEVFVEQVEELAMTLAAGVEAGIY